MSWLPDGTPLGDLEIDEVFVDYDGPRLFTCRSKTDQIYLAGWADEGKELDLWLYLPISSGRLSAVRSGAIALRDAYLRPEGFLYVASLQHSGVIPDSVRPVRPKDVIEDWLPASGFTLDLETPTAPPALTPDELERRALQEGRTRLDLQVHLPRYYRTEAPTRQIGEILISMQGVLENFGALELHDQPPQAGALPDDVTRAMASNVVALSAASFVVGLASNDGQDLFGNSPFSKAVERLLTISGNPVDNDTVFDEVRQLKPRGARSYRRLVRDLASTKGDITLNAGSPGFGKRTAKLTAEKLTLLSEILDAAVAEEPAEISGRMVLVAADSEKLRFGLRDIETDTLYQGKVAPSAIPQVSRATILDEYEAVLIEDATAEGATGETKFSYTLAQLVHVVDPAVNDAPALTLDDSDDELG